MPIPSRPTPYASPTAPWYHDSTRPRCDGGASRCTTEPNTLCTIAMPAPIRKTTIAVVIHDGVYWCSGANTAIVERITVTTVERRKWRSTEAMAIEPTIAPRPCADNRRAATVVTDE